MKGLPRTEGGLKAKVGCQDLFTRSRVRQMYIIHYETVESHKLTIQTDCLTHLKVLYVTYEMLINDIHECV